jgi:23S rRNA (adenine2503-C2)-methyltransferase
MPVSRKYPLRDLLAACQKYTAATRRRITLEYVLVKGVNDALKDAWELARLAKTLGAKVNLIPYSPVPGKFYQPPLRKDVSRFADSLEKQGVDVTVRKSRGKDIRAACGQLAGAGKESQFKT